MDSDRGHKWRGGKEGSDGSKGRGIPSKNRNDKNGGKPSLTKIKSFF